jgi:N-formylglutamate amidohydrolase
VGGVVFVNRMSRLVVDPERFRDDADEVMALRGMGAVYCKTSQGAPLRDPAPTRAEREAHLNRFFDPYHAAFEWLVDEMVARFGRCLILDGHSYPRDPLPFELRPDAGRPDVCLGTDPFYSPDGLVTALEAVCRSAGRSVARDVPFSGTIVPMSRFRSDARVCSVMIELRRDTYMDESRGEHSERYAATREFVGRLVECASAWIGGVSV